MDKSNGKNEFDSTEFEKRLTNLKDTQDSIQAMSAWCLQHRSFHKKLVASWLVVLKQGKNVNGIRQPIKHIPIIIFNEFDFS